MDVPKCLTFNPTDSQVIREFLRPKIRDGQVARSLIIEMNIYEDHPANLPHPEPPSSYIPMFNHWYFVARTTIGPSARIKRTVAIGQAHARWHAGKKSEIVEGGQVIGYKQKFTFKNAQNQYTGWCQHEYTVVSAQLQLWAVSHLYYTMEDDQTLPLFHQVGLANVVHQLDQDDPPHEENAMQNMINGFLDVLH